MCCTTLIAQHAPMATTELMRAAAWEICRLVSEQKTEFSPLRMNWVVVTDENGHRQLRMCWRADRDMHRSA